MGDASRGNPSDDEENVSDWEDTSPSNRHRQAGKAGRSLIHTYPDDVVKSYFPTVVPNTAGDDFSSAYRVGSPQSDEAFEDLLKTVEDSVSTVLNDVDDRASSPEPAYHLDAMDVDDDGDEEGDGARAGAPGGESSMCGSHVAGCSETSGLFEGLQDLERIRRYLREGGEESGGIRRKEKGRSRDDETHWDDNESDDVSGDGDNEQDEDEGEDKDGEDEADGESDD